MDSQAHKREVLFQYLYYEVGRANVNQKKVAMIAIWEQNLYYYLEMELLVLNSEAVT